MKKVISLLLVLVMSFFTSTAFAQNVKTFDSASYVETTSGDTIKIEEIAASEDNISKRGFSDSVYVTRISRNGVCEETIYVDFEKDQLVHEYVNGTVSAQKLSDVVSITKVNSSVDDQVYESDLTFAALSTDYVDNEPLYVTSSGSQAVLTGAPTYSGYSAMGYRGGYYYAPTTYGYLQRLNSGVAGTYYSHLFSFGAGTAVGTAVSIVVAFFTSTGVGLAVSLATAILGAIVDVVTHDWSVKFEVKTYKWSYRIRLNSNTGSIIYSNYRTQDYWKGYNPATGDVTYNYRGSAHDGGFLLANSEMIKTAIDSYLED